MSLVHVIEFLKRKAWYKVAIDYSIRQFASLIGDYDSKEFTHHIQADHVEISDLKDLKLKQIMFLA